MPLRTMVLRNHFGTLNWRSVLIALCFVNSIIPTTSTNALYETTIALHTYYNRFYQTQDGKYCDPAMYLLVVYIPPSSCDEYFEVTALWETEVAKTRYPRTGYYTDVQIVRGVEAAFAGEPRKPIVIHYNQTNGITVTVAVWDVDFVLRKELIIERTFRTEHSFMTPETFLLSNLPSDVAIEFQVTIKCLQLSCEQNCFWPNKLYQCDRNVLSCIGDNFLEVCKRIKGQFTLRLSLTQLSVLVPTTQVQPVDSCNLMITVCMTQATQCETNNWQLVAQAPIGSQNADDNFTHEQTWYDYELHVDSIARVNRVFLAMTLHCLDLSEEAKIELQTSSERNTTLQIATKLANFTASYAIECQQGYHGQFCNKNCPTCKSKSLQYKCSDGRHGATCALQTLCAPSNSKFKTFCGVRRSLNASETPAYEYEVVRQCAFGYKGPHCEAIQIIMNCSAEYCGQLGKCHLSLDAEVHKFKPQCECPPGLQGERCEVCSYLQVTDNNSTHRCTSFIGNYAAVVELQSFTNYKGQQSDGSFCDQAKSQCDTLVEVCVQNNCSLLALTVNRDNVTNNFVSSEALLFAFELNLTQTLQRFFAFGLNFSVYDIDEIDIVGHYASSKNHIAGYEHDGSFVIDGHFPKQQLVYSKNTNTELRATLTLRCARGFHGALCDQKCKSLPTALNIAVDDSLQLASSFSSGCWPSEALLCNSSGVGISCARERLCRNSNDVLSISNGKPQCAAPVDDPCRSKVCNRKGTCFVDNLEDTLMKLKRINSSALNTSCECEPGFGGADCETADWWSCEVSYGERPCKQNGTCLFFTSLGYHKCTCGKSHDVFPVEVTGEVRPEEYCSTMDPCDSWKCTSNGKCVYNAQLGLRHCYCKSGFHGTFCEFTRYVEPSSKAQEMLLIMLLLLITVVIIYAIAKEKLSNVLKCF